MATFYLPTSGGYSTSKDAVKYRIVVTEGTFNAGTRSKTVHIDVEFWRTDSYGPSWGNGDTYLSYNGTRYDWSQNGSLGESILGIGYYSYTSYYYVTNADVSGKDFTAYYDDNGNCTINVKAGVSLPTPSITADLQGGDIVLTKEAAKTTYYTVTWKDGLGNTIETDKVASGGDATPPADPSRLGYTFSGWSGTYKKVTSNQVVNATWTPITYNIDIDCNGGSGVSDFTYTIESSNIVLPTPTREGYTFLGWTGSNGTTPQKSVIITSGSTGNRSYTANWAAETFTITYDGNGGTCEIYDYDEDGNPISSTTSETYSEEVEYATEVYIRPNDDFFTHPDGKGFLNWNTEPDGSGDSWEPGTHTWDDAHDITLYAQWTDAVEFTVTFYANGGKFSDGSTKKVQTVAKGQDATLPENPTRDGKQFQGWTANYKNVTANQVVNAIWGTGVIWIMTATGWVKFE